MNNYEEVRVESNIQTITNTQLNGSIRVFSR